MNRDNIDVVDVQTLRANYKIIDLLLDVLARLQKLSMSVTLHQRFSQKP